MRNPLRHTCTRVAFLAGLPFGIFTEMFADFVLPADTVFDEFLNFVEALPGALFFLFVVHLTDEIADGRFITLLPEKKAVGGFTVAASAACFLIILFDAFGQREMNNFANVWLVDAEAEGESSDDDLHFV